MRNLNSNLRKWLGVTIFLLSLLFVYESRFIQLQYVKDLYLGLLCLSLSIFFILPKKWDFIYLEILTLVLFSYLFGQSIYFRAFNQYGYIATFFNMQDMIGHFQSSVVEFLESSDLKYICSLLFSMGSLYLVHKKSGLKAPKRRTLNVATIILASFGLFEIDRFEKTLESTNTIDNPVLKMQTDYYIYKALPNTNQFVSNFGLIGLAYREVSSYLNDPILQSKDDVDLITDMLLSKTATVQNGMSGIFAGKSLLLIEAESLNYFAIDLDLTPTLYRLKEKGYIVNGYQSPLLTGSTSDIELMLNTSLVPTNDGKVVFETYDQNIFPQTLASVFNQNVYYSMASHNNYGIYYNRTVMMPKLGYEFFDAIGLEAYDNVKDSYVIDHIKWMMYEKGKYLSFWITFNGHQPYGLESLNPDFLAYYEKVDAKYPDLPEAEKVYLAKNMDLDRGIYQLLKDYKNSKVLDNMVLVIVGDHFPKSLFEDKEMFRSACEAKGYSMDVCFRQPMIIWNNDQFTGSIDKVTSPLDVAPTLFDLFGLDYDQRMMLGHSIFDPSYSGFAFDEYGVIKTDHYTFDVLRDTIFHDGLQEESVYREEAYRLYQNLQLSHKIIELDYFNTENYKKAFNRP